MSLETWKQEFYPTPASKPDCSPAEHSLRKWIGLLPRNLKKHKCRRDGGWIHSEGFGTIMGCDKTCALCREHLDAKCKSCPLFKAGFGCLTDHGPYYGVIDGNSPVSAMVSALRKAVKIEKAEAKKKGAKS